MEEEVSKPSQPSKPAQQTKEESKPETDQSKPSELPTKKEEKSDEAEKELMGMGFPADKVKAALKAAFNNRQVAVDYLINVFLAVFC